MISPRTIASTAYTTGYTYESAGRLASVTYPTAGWKVIYARDLAGQVSAVTAKPPSASAVNLATSVTHYPFGPVNSFTYGNALTSTRTYDLDYRMTSVADTTPTVNSLAYTYDAANNVKTITDAVTAANNQTVNYDAIDRLSSATGSYGSTGAITYDSNSNRKAYGTTAYTVPATSNKVSAIGATAISYSSTGNVTAIGTANTFTWNKANQMATAVASATTSTYLYGYDGMRQKITVGAATPTVTQYDQSGNQLTETNSGTETDYAYLDGMPIYAIQPATSVLSAIHTDKLGTPQKATNASKAIVFTANYDPNGKTTPTTTITQNLRFPGQYNDVTGFYHNGFRDYAPDYTKLGGRYLEVDPIGLAGGINPYVYAGDNAYRNVDPSGLLSWLPIFAPGFAQAFAGLPPLPPIINCPSSVVQCANSPAFQPYFGVASVFHCGNTGYDQTPASTPPGHQEQECFYGSNGNLDVGACGGSPDDYDARTSSWLHTFSDRGGIYNNNFPNYTDAARAGYNQSRNQSSVYGPYQNIPTFGPYH